MICSQAGGGRTVHPSATSRSSTRKRWRNATRRQRRTTPRPAAPCRPPPSALLMRHPSLSNRPTTDNHKLNFNTNFTTFFVKIALLHQVCTTEYIYRRSITFYSLLCVPAKILVRFSSSIRSIGIWFSNNADPGAYSQGLEPFRLCDTFSSVKALDTNNSRTRVRIAFREECFKLSGSVSSTFPSVKPSLLYFLPIFILDNEIVLILFVEMSTMILLLLWFYLITYGPVKVFV